MERYPVRGARREARQIGTRPATIIRTRGRARPGRLDGLMARRRGAGLRRFGSPVRTPDDPDVFARADPRARCPAASLTTRWQRAAIWTGRGRSPQSGQAAESRFRCARCENGAGDARGRAEPGGRARAGGRRPLRRTPPPRRLPRPSRLRPRLRASRRPPPRPRSSRLPKPNRLPKRRRRSRARRPRPRRSTTCR